ncbi:lactonase family protein [Verrucomicrobiales bacterium]|jgi:6-phosphogluconolactonase|nr:lactonase family protein [Verrucomicrobiales bacterium]
MSKPLNYLTLLIGISLISTGLFAETVVYVSESKDKKIAVYSLDESTGDLARISEVEFDGATGCLAVNRANSKLHASIRSIPAFDSLSISPEDGSLQKLASRPAQGSAAYIYLDATEDWLLSACYGEGLVAVTKVINGAVEGDPQSILDVGKKAHCIQTDPANQFAFCPQPVDLNQVVQIKFDAEKGILTLNDPPAMKAGERDGPRHLQFHPNGKWVYVVNEQGKSVTLCDYEAEAGNLTSRQTLSTVPDSWDKSQGSCADIEISADGRFVYASNRGHNSIAMFSINPSDGTLTSLGQAATGEIPRSFNLIEGGENFVVAAGQKSNDLTVYRRDVESGLLTKLKTYECGGSPVWVVGVKLPE